MKDPGARLQWLRWAVPAGMCLIVFALAFTAPHFFTAQNLRNVGTQVPVNLILAAGMTLVILTGGIDLSVGSVHALCGITAALVLTRLAPELGGATVPAAIAASLLVGALLGAFNGSAIGWIGIPPFIATLAMMSVARGLAKHLTNGIAIGIVGPDVTGWEAINRHWLELRPLGLGFVNGVVPVSFLLACAVLGALALLLRKTRPGRRIYAVGGSEGASHLSGVPVARTKLLVYTLMGALAGLAGLVETAAQQSGSPIAGMGYELNAIAAVVVGGTRLSGGQGGMLGTFIGAVFIIGLMNNALNLHNVSPFWQEIAKGAIIFSVALVDRVARRD
ncbi:MAG: ABC transporter permease [Armatimonadota bacterium]